ncbi:hypothetical protein GW17_00043090 [Ensete ventricosum]|nr:hypothetical protein GW17_00043090 [Ensete ventricosum]
MTIVPAAPGNTGKLSSRGGGGPRWHKTILPSTYAASMECGSHNVLQMMTNSCRFNSRKRYVKCMNLSAYASSLEALAAMASTALINVYFFPESRDFSVKLLP